MAQLANTAIHQGFEDKFFRCAYQANVIKTLESIKRPTKEMGPSRLDELGINSLESMMTNAMNQDSFLNYLKGIEISMGNNLPASWGFSPNIQTIVQFW